MEPIRDPAVMARVKTTFELYELAEAMMHQNLRRRYPGESEEQLESRLAAWLQDRPGAKTGDASGPFRVRRVFP